MLNVKEANELLSKIKAIQSDYKTINEEVLEIRIKDVSGSELKEYSMVNQKLGYLKDIEFTLKKLGLDVNLKL